MSYDLGIDIGTSYSAAAVRRDSGAVDVVGLGSIADSMPSVVYLSEDGSILIGDSANRRSVTDPQGAAREFKRRLGDSTPIILRTSPFSAEQLYARTLEHVVQRVIEREQGPPRTTIVTHPANWGPYKLELFDQALRISNLDATGLTEPAAAAWAYGAEDRVPVGAKLAIYDLGGGTFDAAVLEKTPDGFEALGESTGIEHLGGVDFDAAILDWVRRAVGEGWPSDPEDPQLATSMLHLRRSCSEAKELLSSERDVQIPVLLPGVDMTLTLTRPEFESMIRPKIDDSISSLESALASAGVDGSDTTIVLVGGSSRIPMIRHELEHRYGSVVANDVDPLYAIATGAAVAAGARSAASASNAPLAVAIESDAGAATAIDVPATSAVPVATPEPEPEVPEEPVAASPQEAPIDLRSGHGSDRGNDAPIANTPPVVTTPPETSSSIPAASVAFEKPANDGPPSWLIPAAIGGLVVLGGLAFVLLSGGGDETTTTEVAGASAVAEVDDPANESEAATEASPTDDATDDSTDAPETVGGAAASSEGMVSVDAGTYTLGTDRPESNDSETLTQTGIAVDAFYIDATEVTNADWKTFVDTAGAATPASWGRAGFDEALAEHPVLGVNFEWAAVYCQALSKRLPTETEWEVAARGSEALIYPWGDDVAAGGIPDIEETYPVGSIPTNVSPVGAFDMVGNAWEWVSDTYDTRVNANFQVLRGGQNGYLRETVTRLPVDPERSNAFTVASFRCAADDVDDSIEPLQFTAEFTVPEVTNEAIEVALPPGVLIQDPFTDSTSGWVEETREESRFGYHPNEFFHLETKAPNTEVFANSPVALETGRPFEVVSSAFVEPNLTQDDGTFLYGVFVGGGTDGSNVSFFVDPRRSLFSIQQRQADGSYTTLQEVSRAIPDDVELTVSVDGARHEFRLNGAVVNTQTIVATPGNITGLVVISDAESSQVHIHFEDFEVAYLDEA